MFEIIYQGIIGLVVSAVDGFYEVNFGNESYDLNKWLSAGEIQPVECYVI